MIKAIAFDVGGVITQTDFPRFNERIAKVAAEQGLDTGAFLNARRAAGNAALSGNLLGREFFEKSVEGFNVKDKEVLFKEWRRLLKEEMKLNKPLLSLISKLKERYCLATLSDVTDMFYEIRKEIGVYNDFKLNVNSFEERMRKPEPAFYNILLKRLNMNPAEVVFIDDTLENVEAARQLGMHSILYTSVDDIKKELAALGVKY